MISTKEQATINKALKILDREVRGSDPLSSSVVTRNFLRLAMANLEREVFKALFLDNQNRVIAVEDLFFGTIDGATVHPREVAKAALLCNAAAVIFAHNHPSGVAEPSQADIGITRRLKSALSLLDIRTLDHFVVGNPDVVSMAERGLV
jgi:DNA repair protein RadC